MVKINKSLCRICIKDDDTSSTKYLSLFENYKDMLLSEHIESIASVEIREGDGLPDRICPECLLQLDGALAFRQKCKFSDTLLRGAEFTLEPSGVKHEQLIFSKLDEQSSEHYNTNDCNTEYLDVEVKPEIDTFNTEFLEDTNASEVLADLHESIQECSEFIKKRAPPDACRELESKTQTKIIKSRSVDLKLICDDCGGSFKSKCKLRVHWKKVHLSEKLTCPVCKRMLKSYIAFNKHMKLKKGSCSTATEVHVEGQGRSRVFHCKYCTYKTNRLATMNFHLRTHTGEKTFQCEYCPKNFAQQSGLICHMETHNEYKVQITCHVCGKHVKGRSRVYRHLKSHDAGKFQCKICSKVVKYKKSLEGHMKRHSGVKGYSCDMCPALFFTFSELRSHQIQVHLKSRKLKHGCDMCEFRTPNKQAIIKHKAKHNGNNIPCLLCGRFFENAQKFARHKIMHEEKKYQCAYCDRSYAKRDSLNTHMKCKHKDKIENKGEQNKKLNEIKLIGIINKIKVPVEVDYKGQGFSDNSLSS